MALLEKGHATGAGSAVVSISNVTAGASLVIAWAQLTSDVRTYTATSSVDGAFTAVVAYTPVSSRRQGQLRLDNVTAGSHTITLQANAGTTSVWAWVFEQSLGYEAGATIPTGSGVTNASGTTHYCAPTGEVDSAVVAALDIITCGTFPNTITTASAGAGYTQATVASNIKAFCQYRSTQGPIADDRGEFHITGGSQTSQGTMAVYEVKDGGAPPASGTWGTTSGWWFGL